jgi:hypothetical protein
MRYTICLAIAALSLCGTYSCRKIIGIEPPPGRNPGDSTLAIDLTYVNTDTTDFGNTFELIISEPGGRILLDTIAPDNTPVIAKMTTTQLLVDVSTIIYSPTFNSYDVTISKSVKPEEWIALGGAPLHYPNGVPATITYTNAPVVDPNTVHFASLPTSVSAENGPTYSGNQITMNYYGFPGNNIGYILFPTLGQYSYQPVHSLTDTISLAQMDTTVKVFYNIPPQYSFVTTDMTGYFDSTNVTKTLNLYGYYQRLPLADLQYPPPSQVSFQKYYWEVDATTANNEFLTYRNYASNPPTGTLNPPLPATPIYTLNSTSNDSFSVSFSQQPTSYATAWTIGSASNIQLSIGAPPDSTLTHPLPLLTSLHSKMLQGQTLSPFTVQNFSYDMVPGVDYNSRILHSTNPATALIPYASELLYLNFAP